MKILLLLFVFIHSLVFADDALIDHRRCGYVNRKPNGEILRRTDVLIAFQKLYPCPSTGKKTGACPKWSKDHSVPLACGGCDSVSNLTWIPNEAKSCDQPWCKDRYERKIYGGIIDSDHCSTVILK